MQFALRLQSHPENRMMLIGPALAVAALLIPGLAVAIAHDAPVETSVTFASAAATVAGTLAMPDEDDNRHAVAGKVPVVVIVGGTLSHTRDGAMIRDGVPPRDALRRLAHALADAGYASLRYDKPGFGASKSKAKWTGSYADEAAVAAAAIEFVRGHKDCGRVIVAGESAGAYLACLAARAGKAADAYVFLGAHCGPGEEIYEYNYASLDRRAEADPVLKEWVAKNLRFERALGRQYKEMFAAAARGDATFTLVDVDLKKPVDLRRRREELESPPDEMFRYIQAPALALAGEYDLNVAPTHAARAVAIMRKAGNHGSTCVIVPGADHSFQQSPDDPALRIRERLNFESFRRPYEGEAYREVVAWLDKTQPGPAAQTPAAAPSKGRGIPEPFARRAVEKVERESTTDTTPERLFLAPGIQIVENITDGSRTAGVETLEGRIGPLLLAEKCQAHFIDMPPGMYCEEHPHSTESIIYTVRGTWVLCSKERRQVMKPGSLFHFAVNTPTGYEVPFGENAYILIFKGQRTTAKEADFINYLKGLSERLLKEQKAGIPYLLKDLPADHPAITFGKQVNPDFEKAIATQGKRDSE